MEYTKLKSINNYISTSINPAKHPDTTFEVYSVPFFETGHPEFLRGDQIASNKAVVMKGDILLCKINPRINRVWIVAAESEHQNIASSEWIVIRNGDYNPEYLAWYFRTPKFQKLMTSEVTGIGGSLTRAQPKRVAEYPVPILDRERQDEVATVLNICSNIIEARKKELLEMDKLIKARFVEMFGTVHNNVFQFAECTLESISDEFFAGGDKPADCTTERDEAHPYPVFANGYDNEGLQGYSAKCRVTQPAVTISARGTIGYCFIREAGFTPVVRLVTIVPNNKVSPVFLKYAIDTMDIKSSGTSQAQLTVPDFKRERIIVPPVELQGQFAAFVSQVDKSKVVVRAALDKAQLLFDSLMQQYFG